MAREIERVCTIGEVGWNAEEKQRGWLSGCEAFDPVANGTCGETPMDFLRIDGVLTCIKCAARVLSEMFVKLNVIKLEAYECTSDYHCGCCLGIRDGELGKKG